MIFYSYWLDNHPVTDSLNNCLVRPQLMVGLRLSRRARKFLKKIQRAPGKYELQETASTIQAELDKRLISYDEALTLGNIIQHRADQFVDDDTIVYAISDRDAYRRTLELYLRDALLSKTEQLLLWEERRRLGISDRDHERLLEQLLAQWKKQGKRVNIDSFEAPNDGGGVSA